jgi:hypothetical protein
MCVHDYLLERHSTALDPRLRAIAMGQRTWILIL